VCSQNCEKQLLPLSCLCVHLEQLATTGQILMKFDIDYFSEACREKSSLIKYDEDNRYFAQRLTFIYDSSLNSS